MSAIIFDFDGTIADSFDVVLDLFYELTGHERFTPAQIYDFKCMSLRKAVKVAHIPPRQIPFLLIKGRTRMRKRLNEVKPFPGIKSTLHALRANGHVLFIMSSNSHHNVETFLKAHALRDYFEGVYGGIGLLNKASALRKVVRQNKLNQAECYAVGDEARDIIAAQHAHIHSIAVAWGYNDISILKAKKPFKIVENPADLLRIFEA